MGVFGLMVEQRDGYLHFFNVDDVINNKSAAIDISDMLVDEKDSTLTYSYGLTKSNTLKYAEDDLVDPDFGSYTFAADTYDKSENVVYQSPYAATDKNIPLYTYEWTAEDGQSWTLNKTTKARLLLDEGDRTLSVWGRWEDLDAKQVTFKSFSFNRLKYENLVSRYWQGYMGVFSASPRIVTKKAVLSPVFMQNLAFDTPVYANGNYYMLLSVKNYTETGKADLELALIDGVTVDEGGDVSLKNAILVNPTTPLKFAPTTVALYTSLATGDVSGGKLIRELNEIGSLSDHSWIAVDNESGDAKKFNLRSLTLEYNDMYLRKDIDDTAHGNILFDKKIGSSIFIDGWEGKGWEIQSTGAAILDSLRVRSDIYVGGNTGSPTFASGFTGWGWQIDTPTATGEMDNLFIRKTFTAYEIVYSQIYGLGGSQIVSDINKIARVEVMSDRYRCYMDDMDGLMLMNLRKGDGVRIQTRTGTTSIKYLFGRCIGVDSDYFDIAIPLIEGTGQPEAGDFALRWGNNEDTDRQGLIYLTTADSGAPFIDVYDGITDASTEGKLKARIGHLTGIRTQRGDQLSGYGAYLNGIYVENSTFILQNGDTIEQTFIAMNGKFESLIDSIRNDISAEGGNILVNSSFSQNTNYWTAANNVHFINVGGEYLWLDGSFYVEKDQVADIYNDNGQNVLRIRNTYILQQNAIMNIPDHTEEEEKTYSFSLFYKVLRPGSCGFGIPGTELYHEEQLPESDSYQKLSKVGKWNGKGDFELRFTGEILIYGVGLFSDEIADAIVKLQTQIDQTDEYIKLLATKDYVDSETGEIYVHFDSQLQITAEQMSGISTKVDNINNTIESAGWITQADGVTLFAKKEMESGKAIVNAINVGTDGILIQANRVNLVGAVTFSMFNSSLQSTINGKVDSSSLGDLAYEDYITKGMMSAALQSELNGKVSESVLGSLAYASSISKNNFASSLLTEFNGKADSSSLKALAYLDKVEQAQLGSTIISGGHIITSLIDTDSIYTNQAYIGNFSIENGWLKCNANIDGSIGYIVMKGTNTEVSFGQNLIPASTGGAFTLSAYIKNSQSNYLYDDGLLNWNPAGNKNVGLQIIADNCDYPVAIYSQGFNSFTGGLSVVTFIPSAGYNWEELKYKDIFVIQANSDSYLTLPTLTQLQNALVTGGYYSNGLALSYQAVVKFTFILTRYSSKVYFRGVSGIPIIGTAGSIYGSGNYTYGQYEATPGTVVTFYYYNNNYYIDSNAF